jgi:hypothetical protein
MGKRARPQEPLRLVPERYWKDLALFTCGWATPILLIQAGWRLDDARQVRLGAWYTAWILSAVMPFDLIYSGPDLPLPARAAILACVWVAAVVHAGIAAPILHRRVAAINAVAALQGIEVELPTAPAAPVTQTLDAATAPAPNLFPCAPVPPAMPLPAPAVHPMTHASAAPGPAAPAPALPVRYAPPAPHVPLPAPHVPYLPPPPVPSAAVDGAAAPIRTAPQDWLFFTSGVSLVRPASALAVAEARARLRRRKKARQILASEPDLALELRIGRPDLPRDYDDGGLIDINHVPAAVLVSELEIPESEARSLIEQREAHGGFSHPEELVYYCDLTPERLNVISGRLVFVPA